MAEPEKIPGNAAADSRVIQLAHPRFFKRPSIFPPFVFAYLPAGDGIGHSIAVHLGKNALYCSCPFQPRPCLHALALRHFYLQTDGAGFIAAETLPDWVSALIAGGGGQLRLAPDPAVARQQRRNERLERAADGFDDLESWLLDTIRRGLATTVSEDPKWYEHIAARMADASLTGLSRTLRLLGSIPSAQPDWAERTLAGLAEIYLALRAFRKRDTLPEALLADLQNWIGIPTKKETVLTQGEQWPDTWRVMGQIETALEDKLKMRRTWLLGMESQRYALLLDYAFGGAPFPPGFPTGTVHRGTVAWYPSAWPLRALVMDDFQPLPGTGKIAGYADFQTFAAAYAQALGQQPWLTLFPATLLEVTVVFKNEKLYALDKREKVLPLYTAEHTTWRLLAVAGGQRAILFGEWDGAVLMPLTVVVVGGRTVEL